MRPLRQPARVVTALAVLTVALAGVVAYADLPPQAVVRAPVSLGPDSTAILGPLQRGDVALAGGRPGDRLLAIDGDTISPSRAAAMLQISHSGRVGDTLAVTVVRGGQALDLDVVLDGQERLDAARFGLSASVVNRVNRALVILAMLAFVVAGALLFVRSRGRGYLASLGTALLAVAGMFGFGPLSSSELTAAGGPLVMALIFAALAIAVAALPAVTSALARFPDGRYGPRWTRRIRWLAGAGMALVLIFMAVSNHLGVSMRLREMLSATVLIGVVALPAVGLAQKYRQSRDAVVRQQMKWVVLPLGVFVAALCLPYLGEVVAVFDASRRATGTLFNIVVGVALNAGLAAVPLGVLAGALNFRPWDADLWIARSAAIGAATLGLAAVFAGGAEALRIGLRSSMGEGAEAVAAALAAVVALAVFNPVREWLTRRADADLVRTRERLTERLPLLLAGRQVVASPEEVGRVAIAAVRDALKTDRAAVLDLDPDGWEAVAVEGVDAEAAVSWADSALDVATMPPCSTQIWEDPVFVLRVPLRSAEDELVGVLALGTHGRGRGYSTEERKALDVASRSLAEALRIAERREEAQARQYARLASLVDRLDGSGDGPTVAPTPAP